MDKPDIITVPYFIYSGGYPTKDICLKGENISGILKKIENKKSPESPFKVIPGFTKDLFGCHHMERCFYYGAFANREEIHFKGRVFKENASPEQVGKLLVPHYSVRSAEELAKYIGSTGSISNDRKIGQLLKNNPDAKSFYGVSADWAPLDPDKVFILNEKQLE